MPLTPSFSVSQQIGLNDTVTLTDTSTGSDAAVVARVALLEIFDGTFLPSNGTAKTEIVVPEVKAVSYIGGVSLQSTGDTFLTNVQDPVLGGIIIGTYIQQSGDTLTTLVTGIINSVNNGSSGYTAENYSPTTLNVIAKAGLGATINGNNATIQWPLGSSTHAFSDGVTEKAITITASQNYWPYSGSAISLAILDKDYGVNITVLWLDENGDTLSVSYTHLTLPTNREV